MADVCTQTLESDKVCLVIVSTDMHRNTAATLTSITECIQIRLSMSERTRLDHISTMRTSRVITARA
jgi:hypothetical protein